MPLPLTLGPSRCLLGATAFAPANLPGLVLWLRADQGLYQDSAGTTPATADGDPVGKWTDQSGANSHVLQATAGKRPTLKLAIVTGQPVVRFDGVDDFLKGLVAAPAMPYTLLAVYQSSDADGSLAGYGTDAGVNDAFYLAANLGALVQNSGNKLYISGTAAGASWHVATVVWTGTDSSFSGQLWRDGTSLAGPTASSGARGAASAETAVVGNTRATGGSPLAGDVAAVLAYATALSAAARQQVERYLGAQYGITVA